ncbi:efflux RND transporter permease subunit, partial [Bacteroides heparinolyticus]
MNLRFFIDRPVFSGVISVVIVLLGMISMFSLPVEQYPDIAPPTINVFATYPGANAETVQKAVITPLEEAINGVEDMTYMTSTASNTGDASIDIYFKQGTNADMAAVNVQNRVNGALSQLPAEATKTGVTTEKQQNAELMTFALYSPDDRFDQTFLNN